jgi:hypothetical protein
LAEAEAFIAQHKHDAMPARIDRVACLIDGFQSSYGMELLASVHWVAVKEHGIHSPEKALHALHAWNDRKKLLMTPAHVNVAWERLQTQGWLPSH